MECQVDTMDFLREKHSLRKPHAFGSELVKKSETITVTLMQATSCKNPVLDGLWMYGVTVIRIVNTPHAVEIQIMLAPAA